LLDHEDQKQTGCPMDNLFSFMDEVFQVASAFSPVYTQRCNETQHSPSLANAFVAFQNTILSFGSVQYPIVLTNILPVLIRSTATYRPFLNRPT
jgi:hypothetical protein